MVSDLLSAQAITNLIVMVDGLNKASVYKPYLAQDPTNGSPFNGDGGTFFATMDVMTGSFAAQLTYRTREAIVNIIQIAQQLKMEFGLTDIPVDYPVTSFVNFKPKYMHALFDYAVSCAQRHELWITPLQSVQRNTHPLPMDRDGRPECPGAARVETGVQ